MQRWKMRLFSLKNVVGRKHRLAQVRVCNGRSISRERKTGVCVQEQRREVGAEC